MNYTYTKILSSYTIGDSLSSVNSNYLTLENETLNLKLTSDNMWSVMQQYYVEYGNIIKDAINTINSIAPNILQATSIVQNSSAGWLKPITVFYPTIFPYNYQNETILSTLSAWVQQYFPVIPEPTYATNPVSGAIDTIISSQPTYVQGQKIIVYAHTWNINFNPSGVSVLTDSTICTTSSEQVCATCKICYFGGTYCGYDTWNDCGGNCSDCSVCSQLNCFYAAPPYLPLYIDDKKTGIRHYENPPQNLSTDYTSYATGQITATVNIQYQDVGELQTINAFVFSVQDCNWVLERSLIG